MIAVQINKKFEDIDVSAAKLKKLVEFICSRFTKDRSKAQYDISIALIDDSQISTANKQFLNHDGPTDCLSFDLSDDEGQRSFELLVNAQRAVKEAKLRGHSSEAELALYITHGLLHNFGFDDSCAKKAKKMHEAEDEILKQFGYGLVYKQAADNCRPDAD